MATDNSFPPAAGRSELAVVTHNTGDTGKLAVPVPLIASVHDGAPSDLFLVQEVGSKGEMIALVRELSARSSRAYGYEIEASMGLGIISSFKITSPRSYRTRATRSIYSGVCGAFGATIATPVGPLDVASIHLSPVPKSRDGNGFAAAGRLVFQLVGELVLPNVRLREAQEIDAWLDSWSANPRILGGDFNTVPASTMGRFLRRRYRDALSATPDMHTGTYWKIRGPRPRVDYILLSREIERVDARVVQREAGDHFPVAATVRYPRIASSHASTST